MTKPLSTKKRSTPSAPEVISGPSTSTTSATPARFVKWKWNATTGSYRYAEFAHSRCPAG